MRSKYKYLFQDIPALVLGAIVVCQLFMLFYVNLNQLQYHTSYDGSAYYLQAVEIWKQKTLLLKNWDYQTTLCWDSPIPLAAIFFGLTNNIFVSYGLANIICMCALLAIFWIILKEMNLSILAKLAAIALVLTPYITPEVSTVNDIGYFSVMLGSMQAYSVKVTLILSMLLIANYFLQNNSSRRLLCLCLCVFFGSFVLGMSSGYYVLIFGILPALALFALQAVIKNDWKIVVSKGTAFFASCAVVCLLGKFIAKTKLGFSSHDSGIVWTGLVDFWDNLGSIFAGILELLGALPRMTGIGILTKAGISFIPNLLITLLVIIGIGVTIRYYQKANTHSPLVSAIIVFLGVHLSVFIFSYTKYGAPIFEIRYLIPVFLLGILLFAMFCNFIPAKTLFKTGYVLLFSIAIILANFFSYYNYFSYNNNYTIMQNVVQKLNSLDAKLVYVYGNDAFLGRNLRTFDLDRVYKCTNNLSTPHRWGDYAYFEDNASYDGATVLLTTPEAYNSLPEHYKNAYPFYATASQDNLSVNIYYSTRNPVDLRSDVIDNVERNFFYSAGMQTNNGTFDSNGALISSGVEGHAAFGPYSRIEPGEYDITLNYSVVNNESNNKDIGFFDIAVGGVQMAQAKLDANDTSVTIEGVVFTQTAYNLEHRVYTPAGVKLMLQDVVFKRH